MGVRSFLCSKKCVPLMLGAVIGIAWLADGFRALLYATSGTGGVPPGISEEYYSGGRNGTVFNTTSRCMEMASPAVAANAGLLEQFNEGEMLFEASYVTDRDAPYGGLGPVYNKISCKNCHPNYGRGRRVENFSEQFGNGYIAMVHTPDGRIAPGYTFMLQTMASPPYAPPARGVKIQWRDFTDKHGNRYPDGTPYNQGTPLEGTLIYPEASLIDPLLPLPADCKVSLESTIGLFGTGLLDAIPDRDIMAEYERQQASPGPIKGHLGKMIAEAFDGREHIGRFTWHNTRATLANGPGFNGAWNVTNVTREDRPQLETTREWIAMQEALGHDAAALRARQPVEMSREEIGNLMVWSRGLAVPAARDLDDPEVKRGKEIFQTIGCASCHKPSWVTGEYGPIPGYSGQKIRPYTDLLMHDMGDVNAGAQQTFRTPPLWGRGLMKNVADHTDMWHDLRARNFEEAILWHFGEGERAREAFRVLTREARAALIRFCGSI